MVQGTAGESFFCCSIHTDISSGGVMLLHGTCWVCDTVFSAAVPSESRKTLWNYHWEIKLVVQVLGVSGLYLQECPNPSVYQIHWLFSGQSWNCGSTCIQCCSLKSTAHALLLRAVVPCICLSSEKSKTGNSHQMMLTAYEMSIAWTEKETLALVHLMSKCQQLPVFLDRKPELANTCNKRLDDVFERVWQTSRLSFILSH